MAVSSPALNPGGSGSDPCQNVMQRKTILLETDEDEGYQQYGLKTLSSKLNLTRFLPGEKLWLTNRPHYYL